MIDWKNARREKKEGSSEKRMTKTGKRKSTEQKNNRRAVTA